MPIDIDILLNGIDDNDRPFRSLENDVQRFVSSSKEQLKKASDDARNYEASIKKAADAHSRALSGMLSETRGWIGDVGDAFGSVGQQILKLSDAETKAIDTTIYMTEKGMALGEVFGPAGAIIGGFGGMVVGAFSAGREQAQKMEAEMKALETSFKKFNATVTQARGMRQFRDDLEKAYPSTKQLSISLEQVSTVDLSTAISQLKELSDATAEFRKLQAGAADRDWIAVATGVERLGKAQSKLQELNKTFGADASETLDRLEKSLLDQRKATDGGAQSLEQLKEQYNAAFQASEKFRENLAKEKIAEAELLKNAEENARVTGDQQKVEEAYTIIKARQQELFRSGHSLLATETQAKEKLGTAEKEAADKAKGLRDGIDEWNLKAREAKEATEGFTGAVRGLVDAAATKVGGKADLLWLDLGKIADGTVKAVEKEIEKRKDAIQKAKSEQQAISQLLTTSRQNIALQQKILDAYQTGGKKAGDFEKSVQQAIGGHKLSDKQEAELRSYLTQLDTVNKLLERETTRDQRAQQSIAIIQRELELRQQLRDTAKQYAEQLQSQLDTAQTLGTRRNDALVNVLLTQGPEAFEEALTSYQKLEAEQQKFYDTARQLEQIKPLYRDFFENILVTEGRNAYDQALSDFQRFRDQYTATIQSIADPALQVFGVLGGAIEANITAGYKAFDGLGIAAQRAVADLLKAKGREYAVKAIGEAGEGFALLATGLPGKAAESFQASVLHGLAAAAAGAGGIGLGGRAGARQRERDDSRNGGRKGNGIDGGHRLAGVENATKVQSATVINLKVYSMTPGTQRDWEDAGKKLFKAQKAYANSGGAK